MPWPAAGDLKVTVGELTSTVAAVRNEASRVSATALGPVFERKR